MAIQHASMAHMNKDTDEVKEVPATPVYSVRPPEDEAFEQEKMQNALLYARQMQAAQKTYEVNNAAGVPPVLDDSIIQQETAKKEVLEKILFFKQDHCRELSIAGLKFKFRILNSNDHSFINNLVVEHEIKEIYKRSLLTVAAAVSHINDMRLEDISSSPASVENPILRKYYELCQWHLPITTALIEAYGKFQIELEAEYSKDFLEN